MKKIKINFKMGTVCVALVAVLGYLIVYYSVKNIDVAMPTSLPVSEDFVIVLDAGHGGMDGGCSSADGVTEKGINLNIMSNLKDLCTVFGYNVEVTRDEDTSIHDKGVEGIGNQKRSDMDNRLAIFNKYDNAFCVSIHQNKFTDPQYSGAQMFYSDTNPENEKIARIMQNQFVKNIQPENTREIKLCGKELFLCYFCKNPTVMIECGFLSNPEEAVKLQSEDYQKQVAFTIFSGINEYLAQKTV
ncbi:MAG: N-acetylmuramoyl-L-alanine amidase [Oscillospiraceae bacterium]